MSNDKDQPPNSPMQEMVSILQRKAYHDVLHAFKAESLALSDARIRIISDLIKEWNFTQEPRADFENTPSEEGSDDGSTNKKEKLAKLQREAYYSVFHAFKAESLALSEVRSMIIRDLREEWQISDDTHTELETSLEDELLVQHLRREENTTCEDSSASPESLIDKWIHIRLSDKEEFIPFHIKAYNPQEETHHLLAAFSPEDCEDPCAWTDIRHFREEDILWPEEDPLLPVNGVKVRERKSLSPLHKRFLKPKENLLRTTLLREARKHTENGNNDEGKDA